MTTVAVYSAAGAAKQVNQDACCYKQADTSLGKMCMAIVCDGVGGLQGGEVASASLVVRFSNWFETALPNLITKDSPNKESGEQHAVLDMGGIAAAWDMMLQQANSHLVEYSKQSGVSLGTTFTGMFSCEEHYLISQVGDCRVYAISSEGCEQLTKDQSLVQKMVAAGTVSLDEAAEHPKRNVILQAVGAQSSLSPVFSYGEFEKDTVYAVACDGMYVKNTVDELSETLFAARVDSEAMHVACERLATQCVKRGEQDDITMVAFVPFPSEKRTKPNSVDSEQAFYDGADKEDGTPTIIVEDYRRTVVFSDGEEA